MARQLRDIPIEERKRILIDIAGHYGLESTRSLATRHDLEESVLLNLVSTLRKHNVNIPKRNSAILEILTEDFVKELNEIYSNV